MTTTTVLLYPVIQPTARWHAVTKGPTFDSRRLPFRRQLFVQPDLRIDQKVAARLGSWSRQLLSIQCGIIIAKKMIEKTQFEISGKSSRFLLFSFLLYLTYFEGEGWEEK